MSRTNFLDPTEIEPAENAVDDLVDAVGALRVFYDLIGCQDEVGLSYALNRVFALAEPAREELRKFIWGWDD